MTAKQLSPETIARLRERGKAQFATSEARKAHGTLTRERMAAAAPEAADLDRLRDAWKLASSRARRRFLSELQDPLCQAAPK